MFTWDFGDGMKTYISNQRVDYEFDLTRQVEARVMKQMNWDPPRIFPLTPTPREEMRVYGTPLLRETTYRHPDPPLYKPPEPPKFELPKLPEPRKFELSKPPEPLKFDFLDPSTKKKEPWEL